ncbi:MAG TPA: acyloxyacyl hydrolase [Thermoanaerobaculia bacterium]|nr:acyloxyacyl hydrolase [Thermoanaerobaculia bacterium]
MRRGHAWALALALLAAGHGARSDERTLAVFAMAGQSFGERDRHGFAEFGSASVQWGRFVSRRAELLVEAHPVFLVRQPRIPPEGPRETVEAAALDLGFRFFPLPRAWRARAYVEVLEGGFYALRRVPAGGSTFNFLTQAGAGVFLPVGEAWHPYVSWRWVHISNAGTGQHNPDWDFSTLLFGASLTVGGAR